MSKAQDPVAVADFLSDLCSVVREIAYAVCDNMPPDGQRKISDALSILRKIERDFFRPSA
jgi:hypothetical protein